MIFRGFWSGISNGNSGLYYNCNGTTLAFIMDKVCKCSIANLLN